MNRIKCMMKRIRLFRYAKSIIWTLYAYFYDIVRHFKYSLDYQSSNYNKFSLRCSIMLLNHQLEKAQTYTTIKEGYGKEKLCKLINEIDKYIKLYGTDNLIMTSVAILRSHFSNQHAWKDSLTKNRFEDICERLECSSAEGGVSLVDYSTANSCPGLELFLSSRRSCRTYSSEAIPSSDIRKAVKIAMTSPSACNRQSIRIHSYRNKEQIREIILAQKSDIEWCFGADQLFIITSNDYFYRNFLERNTNMFDAGLFSMTLNLALHNMGIGSCFKMAQKSPFIDNKTKKIAKINPEEDICVLMLIGRYPDKPFLAAKSVRLYVDDILQEHAK